MKALSIRQPWAWLIVHGGKDIENRDWWTRIRGRIVVHASKGMTEDEYFDAVDTARAVGKVRPYPPGTVLPAFKKLERGGIVGTVNILDCVEDSDSPWFFGKYGFRLSDPKPLPFQPWKGQLGFFEIPDQHLSQEDHK